MNPSRVVTFYSYKGGTGRSMALANVAWILAGAGRRVLVIDWDLEAPGLHHYFKPFLRDPQLIASPGLIDYFVDYAGDAAAGRPFSGKSLLRYARSIDWSFEPPGTLDFIGAGRLDPSYALRVGGFPWQNFYERLGGHELIDRMRADLMTEYDYILIDSRTGFSDTSGICTVVLPDTLVICFTLNAQSVEGSLTTAASVLSQRRERPIELLPVPMQVEYGEKALLEDKREYARVRFEPLVPGGLPSDYWGAVEFPYVPFYAFTEIPAPFADAPFSTGSILTAAENLTRFLTRGDVFRAPFIDDATRQKVRSAYMTSK